MKYKSKQCSYVYTETPCGRIKGIRKNGLIVYKGIRYATAGRWEEPKVVTSWEGEYDATKQGHWCPQYNAFFDGHQAPFSKFYYDQNAEKIVVNYSEDCLNLNIWVPEGAENAPVAVFVHGGSFVSGGNGLTYVIGDEYCKRGIILISINYRLNAFSSIYEKGHPANLCLRDVIAAFQWIKSNINAFGGNPDNIVAIGESAGAITLQCLLYAPQARGLLSGSIMMSGGGNLDNLVIPAPPIYAETTWNIIKKKYNVNSIEELKQLPAEEIYMAWTEASNSDINLAAHNAKPIIDGEIIPKPVAELTDDEINNIPCIIGMSSEDMWPFTLYTKAIEWGIKQSEAGRCPVYAYYLDRQLPGDDAGAYHGCDLWYAFGALDLNWRPFTEIDYRIADNMIDYFTAFVKSGNPNNGVLAEWTPITKDSAKFLNFGDKEASMCEPPADKLEKAIQNTTKPFPGM